jgi:hypothetical protein
VWQWAAWVGRGSAVILIGGKLTFGWQWLWVAVAVAVGGWRDVLLPSDDEVQWQWLVA